MPKNNYKAAVRNTLASCGRAHGRNRGFRPRKNPPNSAAIAAVFPAGALAIALRSRARTWQGYFYQPAKCAEREEESRNGNETHACMYLSQAKNKPPNKTFIRLGLNRRPTHTHIAEHRGPHRDQSIERLFRSGESDNLRSLLDRAGTKQKHRITQHPIFDARIRISRALLAHLTT